MKLLCGEKLVVSTTSVFPSQRPRESPLHCRTPWGRCGRPSRGMTRVSWIASRRQRHVAGRLQNLVIAHRARRVDVLHAKPRHAVRDAAQRVAELLWAGNRRFCPAAVGGGVLANLALPICRHRRNFPIGRIHDQRRSILDRPLDHHRGTAGRIRVLEALGVGEQRVKEIVAAGKVTIGFDGRRAAPPAVSARRLPRPSRTGALPTPSGVQGALRSGSATCPADPACRRASAAASTASLDLRRSPAPSRRPGQPSQATSILLSTFHFTFYFLLFTFYFLLSPAEAGPTVSVRTPPHRSAHSPGLPSFRSCLGR